MIYALLTCVGLVLPTAITWVYFDLLSTSTPAIQQAAYSIGKAIQFALPAWGWSLRKQLEHSQSALAETQSATTHTTTMQPTTMQPTTMQTTTTQPTTTQPTTTQPTTAQWPKPDYKRSLLWGLGTGLAIAAAALILYHWVLEPSGWMAGPTEQARAKLRETGLNSVPVFLAVALFYSLCHSGLEEYYWRWFMFRHLTLRFSLAMATVVSSLGFMAHHVLVLARFFGWGSPLTYLLALCVAVGGVIWAVLYRRYGTLAGPWLSHAFVDAAIFAIAYQMADWS